MVPREGVEPSIPCGNQLLKLASPAQVVGGERLELSWVAPHGPKPCAYANSATRPPAVRGKYASLPRTFARRSRALVRGSATSANFLCASRIARSHEKKRRPVSIHAGVASRSSSGRGLSTPRTTCSITLCRVRCRKS